MKPLPAQDLRHVLQLTRPLWEGELAQARIFVTGGTGFIGRWLLESFALAQATHARGARMTVLSRTPEAFLEAHPHLALPGIIDWVRGDVADFSAPGGAYSHVMHAATEADAKRWRDVPTAMERAVVEGTLHTLRFAATRGCRRFLLTSSGAVYGTQPPEVGHVTEPEWNVDAPQKGRPATPYGEAKRSAERLGTSMARLTGMEFIPARLFAFAGPGLPLDRHFAAGNFLRDALRGGPITIEGDGTPLRSYQHPADTACWLWTLLCKARSCRPVNVGSEEAVNIAELARAVALAAGGQTKVEVLGTPTPGALPARYVPSTQRAQQELALTNTISLEEGLARTIAWLRDEGQGTHP